MAGTRRMAVTSVVAFLFLFFTCTEAITNPVDGKLPNVFFFDKLTKAHTS